MSICAHGVAAPINSKHTHTQVIHQYVHRFTGYVLIHSHTHILTHAHTGYTPICVYVHRLCTNTLTHLYTHTHVIHT